MVDYPAISGVDDASQTRVALIQNKQIVHAPLLGLPIQPLDAMLTALAALVTVADRGLYFTGADAPALFTLTAAGRALLDDADAAAQRATLGVLWEHINTTVVSSAASVIWTDLSAYRRLRVSGYLLPATNLVAITGSVSTDNGASWISAAASYFIVYLLGTTASVASAGTASQTTMALATTTIGNTATDGLSFSLEIDNWNQARSAWGRLHSQASGAAGNVVVAGTVITGTVARNALRIISTSGNLASGYLTLEGVRG